jgi:hypothetical protein
MMIDKNDPFRRIEKMRTAERKNRVSPIFTHCNIKSKRTKFKYVWQREQNDIQYLKKQPF